MPDITIFYRKSNDYKIIAATGVWGGVNLTGEIVFDFIIDKQEIPQQISFRPEAGSLIELSREGDVAIRESQVGIVLRPDIAHSIGSWLIQKAREAGFVPGTERGKHEGNA